MDEITPTQISTKLVMELRNETNLPMMKCKEALLATNGNKEEAVTWLRKQGIQTIAKFEGRETPNGRIDIALYPGSGSLVLVGCQTDFVANNEMFKTFVKDLANIALTTESDTVEKLNIQMIHGELVSNAVTNMIQKLGENIVISKVHLRKGSIVDGYNHGSVATLVVSDNSQEKVHQVALHITANDPAPISLGRKDVDPKIIEKETEIILASPELKNKPDKIAQNIVAGKLNKFYKKMVLLEQEMLFDALKNETVQDYCLRHNIVIFDFVRVAV